MSDAGSGTILELSVWRERATAQPICGRLVERLRAVPRGALDPNLLAARRMSG